MQRFLDLFISINCSTCFRRFLRPSSGAQNCTYSVRYFQINTVATVDEMERGSISSTIAAGSSIGLTIPDAVCTVLCSWWWAEGRLKHVEQFIEINRSGKRCILLVVLWRYTCDARTYERQILCALFAE
jgi:hypothetical protein